MAWQYSNPLNGALLAAGGQSDSIGYKPYFSSYDTPLFTSRYQPRTNFYSDRSLFDDLELELEVDDSILSPTRYRPPVFNNQPSYVPSYFNSLKASLNNTNSNYDNVNNESNFYSEQNKNDETLKQKTEQAKYSQKAINYSDNLPLQTKRVNNNNINNTNNNKVKKNTINVAANKGQTKKQANLGFQPVKNQPNQQQQQQQQFQQQQQQQFQQQQFQQQQQQFQNDKSTPNYQRLFAPIPFQQTPTIQNNINSVESSANIDGSTNNHNNQQLRFLQYQQRLLQQQEMNKNDSLSELEILKIKQQQDKQLLLQAIAANANKDKYQPFFQEHHLLKQKQYSETSIPSTNADPLQSNSPTPPMMNHRMPRVNFDKAKPNQGKKQQKLQQEQQQGFYFKLNDKADDQQEPGSYLNTMRDARIREQRLTKDKYTANDYKQYQKNYGFGRDFLPFETETKREKLEKARKREEYSKMIKERNTILMEGFSKYQPTVYSNEPITKRSFGASNKVKLN